MLHDIEARQADFGVWKFWDELTQPSSPILFFTHSWGLGIIRKPGAEERRFRFRSGSFGRTAPWRTRDFIRHYYSLRAATLDVSQYCPKWTEPLPPTFWFRLFRA